MIFKKNLLFLILLLKLILSSNFSFAQTQEELFKSQIRNTFGTDEVNEVAGHYIDYLDETYASQELIEFMRLDRALSTYTRIYDVNIPHGLNPQYLKTKRLQLFEKNKHSWFKDAEKLKENQKILDYDTRYGSLLHIVVNPHQLETYGLEFFDLLQDFCSLEIQGNVGGNFEDFLSKVRALGSKRIEKIKSLTLRNFRSFNTASPINDFLSIDGLKLKNLELRYPYSHTARSTAVILTPLQT